MNAGTELWLFAVSVAGIALFILLPIVRVILMLTIYLRDRDCQFAVVAAVVLLVIFAGCAVGLPYK
jgi:uncharacterized membrane protein